MREPLLFVCPNKSSQNKGHPTRRRLRRCTPMLAATGCGQNSRRFGDAQTCWPPRRGAPDTRCRCASPSSCNGTEYRRTYPRPSVRGLYWVPWAQRRAVEAESEKDGRMSESRAARRVSGRPLSAGAAQGIDAKHRRKTGCRFLWLLSFGQANESDSRCRAKQKSLSTGESSQAPPFGVASRCGQNREIDPSLHLAHQREIPTETKPPRRQPNAARLLHP